MPRAATRLRQTHFKSSTNGATPEDPGGRRHKKAQDGASFLRTWLLGCRTPQSTLFRAHSKRQAEDREYPFTTSIPISAWSVGAGQSLYRRNPADRRRGGGPPGHQLLHLQRRLLTPSVGLCAVRDVDRRQVRTTPRSSRVRRRLAASALAVLNKLDMIPPTASQRSSRSRGCAEGRGPFSVSALTREGAVPDRASTQRRGPVPAQPRKSGPKHSTR